MQLWKQMHLPAYSMLSETKCHRQRREIPWLQRFHISKYTKQNCMQRNKLRNQRFTKNKSISCYSDIKLGIKPCYQCFGILFFVSHRLIYIWKDWMSCKAKPIDTDSKWNPTPIHHLTSMMESNSRPDREHTYNNQYCCCNPSNWRLQSKF